MSSVVASKQAMSKMSYFAIAEFHNDFFAYSKTGLSTIVRSAGKCPRGRFLYENGRKLFPGANPGVFTYMVGVYDPVSFLNGFIDPNSKVFIPMGTFKPHTAQIADVILGVFSRNPNGGEKDQAPGVFTLANSQFGANVDISGNLTVLGTTTTEDIGARGDVDISGNLIVYGTTTLNDITVNNLTIRGNATQIDMSDMTSEQFSITNNGTGPALIVNQLGASDVVHFKDDSASVFIIKDGGNVGINTSSPTYKLDVNGSLNALSIYQSGALLVPPGSLMMFIAASVPGGWLLCDGGAVSRSMYAALFATIGVTYGSGNGITTFNLPDMRGRAPVGAGTGAGLTVRTLGGSGGAETHTLGTSEIPSHTHTGTTDSAGSHTHTHNANADYPGAGLVVRNSQNTRVSSDTGQPNEINLDTSVALGINSAGDHTHTFTTAAAGGSGAHNNMQPYLVVNYIIKF